MRRSTSSPPQTPHVDGKRAESATTDSAPPPYDPETNVRAVSDRTNREAGPPTRHGVFRLELLPDAWSKAQGKWGVAHKGAAIQSALCQLSAESLAIG